MAGTNPNGANGTQSDPREQVCWDFYIEGVIAGRENAYESAIKAGYTESNAKNVTMREWFKERLGRLKRKDMLSKAEKVLEEMLGMPVETMKLEKNGDDYTEVVRTEPALVKIKQDTAKFIAEKVGKEHYSSRSELTGKDGESLIPDTESKKKAEDAVKNYLNGLTSHTDGQ